MQASELSEFERFLLQSDNQLGSCVLLILTWIAASTGSINDAEKRKIVEISVASKRDHDVSVFLAWAKNKNRDAIRLACKIIQHHFQGEKADLFLEMAIGMALADGHLFATENYILRFLADLLGISRNSLNTLFIKVTGRTMPEPSDPSMASYWHAKQHSAGKQKAKAQHTAKEQQPASQQAPETIQAYAILGLPDGASKEEIKHAYHWLAQVHHPDRFTSLGNESVAAATITFARIKQAYDHLVSHA
ncbi:DnaJ domain-containing protein [Methylophaga sp. OBS4]|uniref:DnaJ domain-containing protein n=1 Tax=Methylophaga sp. OBS4 TaxID=2991935 RepID=UPI00224EE352|nr:DnaJ domain-containing protein [Methylophaga sp. OBS4]MCX4186293.1 DnaJ domain-containing protein [Methylophaga sp. OBS4]